MKTKMLKFSKYTLKHILVFLYTLFVCFVSGVGLVYLESFFRINSQ